MIKPRDISSGIFRIKDKYPILAVTGPRQSGKTTLLQQTFRDYRYVSLENPDNLAFATEDPNGFLKEFDQYVIFDEIQRVPHLFSYLQTVVDASGLMGQFILSGSQNFHLLRSITQSLAGRVAIFRLFPFDFNELKSAGWILEDPFKQLIKGFYPALYSRKIEPDFFYSNYLETYIRRDVTDIINIRDYDSFNRFLSLCADRAGQLLNLNSMANDCDISQPTAKAWLTALENSYIVFRLYPYHNNFSKRIIKTPKLYFYDTGLLSHLLKINSASRLKLDKVKSHLFENMIIAEYVKQKHHNMVNVDVSFWRDAAGREIDLIVLTPENGLLVEIKATATVMPDMFKNLNYFSELSKWDDAKKVLVHAGDFSQKRTAGEVIPWSDWSVKIG